MTRCAHEDYRPKQMMFGKPKVEMITELRSRSVHYSVKVDDKIVWQREIFIRSHSMQIRQVTAREQERIAMLSNDGKPVDDTLVVSAGRASVRIPNNRSHT